MMDDWWMLDWFSSIWSSFLDANWLRRGSVVKIRRVMEGSLCVPDLHWGSDRKNAAPERLQGVPKPPFWSQKRVCEPPINFPKPPQRPPKSNKSCERKQSSTKGWTSCVWRWIFGEFGRQNNDLFKQDSKIKLSFIRRCRRCKTNEKTIGFLMILRIRSFERLIKKLWKFIKN